MNLEVAKRRYKDVFLPDVIDNTDEDFLAKHVPMKRLYLTDHAELLPKDRKNYLNEEEIFDHLFIESDDDQFVLVKGASGAGKSHLIRWINTLLEIKKDDSEVILYVKRADNTLKGTIKQLIELPEIRNMPNKELYKKLVSASTKIPEIEFKNSLYYGFVNLIDSDDRSSDDEDYLISHVDRKHLVALMQNSLFKDKLMELGGPIDRIYTKIAENNTDSVNDQAAQFVFSDFEIDSDIQSGLLSSGADKKAQKLASKLIDNQELTNKIVLYVNRFIEKVVQRCTGLEAGDLREVIEDIRQELYKQGKKLTILIEDISAASGVDDSLLDALLTNKSGYPDKNLCRINSIVGVADGYYRDNFRTNTKGRIKKFVIVPDDMFDNDQNGLVEFVARYLNTVSLEEKQITEWINNKAPANLYPIHTVTIGHGWGECKIGSKSINLFPFTKNAIQYLYRNLDVAQRNPRSLMRLLIEPYVNDALNNLSEFPTSRFHLDGDTRLQNAIFNRTDIDDNTKYRLSQFMYIWGDGTSNVYIDKGVKYIAGLPESVYAELKLPVIEGEVVDKPVADAPETPPEEVKPATNDQITENKQVSLALKEVDTWIHNKDYKINFGATTASVRALNNARNDINNYLFAVIDWISEGVSIDTVTRIEDRKLVSFERQTQKSNSIIVLPATLESRRIIEAFVKWREVGNQSWQFPNASDYLYLVQKWTDSIKGLIISEVVNYSGKKVDYYSYAVAAEYYRLILNGYCKNYQKANNFTPEMLLQANEVDSSDNGHTRLWNDLKNITNSLDGQQVTKCVLQYYNLVQGTAKESTNYEIDFVPYSKAVRKVINTGLKYEEADLQLDDPVKKRKIISEHLKKILDRVDKVVEAEKDAIGLRLDTLKTLMDVNDEIDETSIKDVLDSVKKFYDQAQIAHVSVAVHVDSQKISNCKKNASNIASSIKTAMQILSIEDSVESLIRISKDPLFSLEPFINLLEKTQADVIKADIEIKNRIQGTSPASDDSDNNKYQKEKKIVADCKAKLEALK